MTGSSFALTGGFRQVAGELGKGLAGFAALPVGGSTAAGDGMGRGIAQLLHDAGVHFAGIDPDGLQDAESHVVAFTQNSHQQVLGADIAGTGAGGFTDCQFHHRLGAGVKP